MLLLLLGAEMRLRQWAGARSLWLDEALIARSLVSRDYVELVATPLQGDQAAPVLWLWATRLALDLFGEHERALRLVPLLGGLVALVLSWRLARRLLAPALVPVALLLVVLSPSLLYFSSEVKPYSVDVAVCLGLSLLALRVPRGAGPGRPLQLLALAGAAAVWASFAAVLLLAGLSVLLVLGALPRWRQALGNAAVLFAWVLSLGLAYVAVLHRLADSTVLSGFWGYTFPRGSTDLPAWLLRRAVDLSQDPLELAPHPLGLPLWPLALALLALGIWRLRSRALLLATAAVPVATVAAALSLYPFASRLALWLVPLAAVALAAVLPARLDHPGRLSLGVAALAVVVAPMAARSLPQVVAVHRVEELRPVMEQVLAQRRPGDLVLVDIAAKAPFDFYTPLVGLGRDGVVLFATTEEVGGRCNDVVALKTGRFATRRVWVVFAHALRDTGRLGTRADLLARIEDVTNVRSTVHAFSSMAVLFDPTAPAAAPSGEPRNLERCLAVVRTVPPTG